MVTARMAIQVSRVGGKDPPGWALTAAEQGAKHRTHGLENEMQVFCLLGSMPAPQLLMYGREIAWKDVSPLYKGKFTSVNNLPIFKNILSHSSLFLFLFGTKSRRLACLWIKVVCIWYSACDSTFQYHLNCGHKNMSMLIFFKCVLLCHSNRFIH